MNNVPWCRFGFVHDINDHITSIKSGLLTIEEVNAASGATIIIDRMLRNGRSSWRRKMLNALMRRRLG